MNESGHRSLNFLERFLWITLPLSVGRIWSGSHRKFMDGYYVFAFAKLPQIIFPALAFAGLLLGLLQPGFERVYTESASVLCVFCAIGMLGGHFGVGLFIGFVMGNLSYTVLYDSNQSFWLNLAASLIEYMSIYVVLIEIPKLAKYFSYDLVNRRFFSEKLWLSVWIGYGTQLLTCFSLVYLWTQLVPLIIRPVATWHGQLLRTPEVNFLQESGFILAATSSVALVVRLVLQYKTATNEASRLQVDRFLTYLQKVSVKPSIWSGAPYWLKGVCVFFLTIFFMAGILENLIDFCLFSLLIGLVFIIQTQKISFLPQWWAKAMLSIPALIKVIAFSVIVIPVFHTLILNSGLYSQASFTPFVFATGTTALLFCVIFPPARGEATQ